MYKQKNISAQKSVFGIDIIKKYLRIDNDAEDEILLICMNNAMDCIEERIGVVIGEVERSILFEHFSSNIITLKSSPIIDVESIKLNDVILDPKSYQLHNDCKITLESSASGKLELVVKFGYKDFSDIPSKLKTSFLELISHIYQNKSGWNSRLPRSFMELTKELQKARV